VNCLHQPMRILHGGSKIVSEVKVVR